MKIRDFIFLLSGGLIVFLPMKYIRWSDEIPYKVQGGETFTIYPKSLCVETNDSTYQFNSDVELSNWIYLASVNAYKKMSKIEFQNRVENFSSFILWNDGSVEVYSVCPYDGNQYSLFLNRVIKDSINHRDIYYNDSNLLNE